MSYERDKFIAIVNNMNYEITQSTSAEFNSAYKSTFDKRSFSMRAWVDTTGDPALE